MPVVPDEILALGIQQGQPHDLAELVERYHSPLLGYLYRMTSGDRVLAEDLVQETFLRVLSAIRQYHYPRPFKPWLYMIATNLVRDHYKQAEQRYTEPLPAQGDVQIAAYIAPAGPESRLLAHDEASRVAQAVQALPSHQRETVILRYYQNLALTEIAQILAVPVGTIKSRLSLGLGRLRSLLTDD